MKTPAWFFSNNLQYVQSQNLTLPLLQITEDITEFTNSQISFCKLAIWCDIFIIIKQKVLEIQKMIKNSMWCTLQLPSNWKLPNTDASWTFKWIIKIKVMNIQTCCNQYFSKLLSRESVNPTWVIMDELNSQNILRFFSYWY
jgi:hypothetical protein